MLCRPGLGQGGWLLTSRRGRPRSARCRLVQQCAGLLRLQNAKAPGARTAVGKTVTYGSANFTIAAGKTKTIRIKLSQTRPRADAQPQKGDGLGQHHQRERRNAASISAKLTLLR